MTAIRSRWLELLAIVALAASLVRSFTVQADVTQGDVQRLMYVHVPSAWLAFLAFGVTVFASAAWLRTRQDRWDRLAAASAEVGVVFTALAIAAGMIWARPVWGQFWTWEPRLVTTALLFFIYLGYLSLRKAVLDPAVRARRAAIMGIIAFIQVPIVAQPPPDLEPQQHRHATAVDPVACSPRFHGRLPGIDEAPVGIGEARGPTGSSPSGFGFRAGGRRRHHSDARPGRPKCLSWSPPRLPVPGGTSRPGTQWFSGAWRCSA